MRKLNYELLTIFKNIGLNENDIITEVQKNCTYKHFNRNDNIRNIENKEVYLVSGFCKCSILDLRGQETTLSFYMSGDILLPSEIRKVYKPIEINLKAFKNSEIIIFDVSFIKELRLKNSCFDEYIRKNFKKEFKNKLNKEILMATQNAEYNLENLRRNFPGIENSVLLSDIASYLGITPRSLSRLRRKN